MSDDANDVKGQRRVNIDDRTARRLGIQDPCAHRYLAEKRIPTFVGIEGHEACQGHRRHNKP
jgi:hypothetical protein